MAESTEHAEAQVIKQFIPTLVVAVCDCVQNVSDKCLAKGLISESTSKRVLDPRGGTSEERARTLIHSVRTSTKTDRSCFQIFLEVLDEELPYIVKEKVLSDMKKELADRAAMTQCKAVVHVSQGSRPVPLDQCLECIQQQSSFLGRYEDSVSKHASAATQKSLIEETLKRRSEESGRLRTSLDILSQSHDHERDEKQITTTRNRLSACETEMAELRERVEELESIIEEEGMRARRGRNTIKVETKRLIEEFSRQSQKQFSTALKDKELEYKQILSEKEAEIRRQLVQDKMNLEIKDLKHEVALLNKEVKIKDLQLSMEQKGRKSHSELKVSGSPVLEGVGLLHRPLYNKFEDLITLSSLYEKCDSSEPNISSFDDHMESRHLQGIPMRIRKRSSPFPLQYYANGNHTSQSHQLEMTAKRRKTQASVSLSKRTCTV